MDFLNFIMPIVAIVVVCMLFAIPTIWSGVISTTLLGTVFGVIEKWYYGFSEKRLNKAKIKAAELAKMPQPMAKKPARTFAFGGVLPTIIVAVPVLLAIGISIHAFTSYHSEDQALTPSPEPEIKIAGASAGPVDGASVFSKNCAVCHQADGKGVPGTYPPLAGSNWVNGNPVNIIRIVHNGLGGEITVSGAKFNNVMPAFGAVLSPEEIAAVATHIRSSFGNKSAAVDVKLVNDTIAALTKSTQLSVSDLIAN